MIKPEQVPENVWVQVALRLESVGCLIPDNVAKLIVAEAINAWQGMQIVKERETEWAIYLDIPAQEEMITPSCGCVFCDIGATHPDGIKCTNWHDGGA